MRGKVLPYVMTLFMFVFLANMLGLIPMSFTTTSHVAVTAVLALMVFLTVTLVGFSARASAFWRCSGSSAPLVLRLCCRDRDHFVFRAPAQPFHPSWRQPGWPAMP